MDASIAAAVIAASKSKAASADEGRIGKSIGELNSKFDRISEQLKSIEPDVSAPAKEAVYAVKRALSGGKQSNIREFELRYARLAFVVACHALVLHPE
ncbi:MAG TPA: hypothetical protein VGJ42_00040 [Nitrososphaera sp.]